MIVYMYESEMTRIELSIAREGQGDAEGSAITLDNQSCKTFSVLRSILLYRPLGRILGPIAA